MKIKISYSQKKKIANASPWNSAAAEDCRRPNKTNTIINSFMLSVNVLSLLCFQEMSTADVERVKSISLIEKSKLKPSWRDINALLLHMNMPRNVWDWKQKLGRILNQSTTGSKMELCIWTCEESGLKKKTSLDAPSAWSLDLKCLELYS